MTSNDRTTQEWKANPDYQKVAEANQQYYNKFASQYDATESILTDTRQQQYLAAQLEKVIEACGRPPGTIEALDACGGTGNVALKLVQRGVRTTLSDISEQQLAIFLRKCEALGVSAETHCGDIANWLSNRPGTYDLVIFSSALHHLQDYRGVLGEAYGALRPGGLVFTIYDPTSVGRQKSLTRLVRRFDYYCFKVFDQFADLPAAIGRRLRRTLAGTRAADKSHAELNANTVGMLAEYHLDAGIDDLALVEYLRQIGYQVVWHHRTASARYPFARKLVEWLGDRTDFELLLRKPVEKGSDENRGRR